MSKTRKVRCLMLDIGKLISDATKLCLGSLVLGAAIRETIPEATDALRYNCFVSRGGYKYSNINFCRGEVEWKCQFIS